MRMSSENYAVHTFDCTHEYDSGRIMDWIGTWQICSDGPGVLEMDITGRGSGYRVILGESTVGKYLFIPSIERGCVLSRNLCDYYWNLSHLQQQINTTDAVTIVSAVRGYGEYLKHQELGYHGLLVVPGGQAASEDDEEEWRDEDGTSDDYELGS